MKKSFVSLALAFSVLPLSTTTLANSGNLPEQPPIIEYSQAFIPEIAKNGMVSSQEAIASQVGADILAAGGNAIDAAVAVGFALAVTLPQAGNVGGGGFMMVHLADTNKQIAIDYREMAPQRAHRDMFLDHNGEVDRERAGFSHLAAGVPGTVAGLLHALENYGTMSRAQVLAPAIQLATEGFEVNYGLEGGLKSRVERLTANAATAKAYYKANNEPYRAGEILKLPDLAMTLQRISDKGRDGFYKGKTADLIVAEMSKHGGLIDHDDLEGYKVVERIPVRGEYKGYEIVSMPPPSSGGVHLIQILNILEGFDLKASGQNSAQTLHFMIEAMRRAYADRSKHLGDPDFYAVPVNQLTDKAYASKLRAGIDPLKASKSSDIAPSKLLPDDGPNTTHYSVSDRFGNLVANTYTLNYSYGSGITVEGAGFLLNNEMDDFSAKPGSPNAYGLLGDEANAVEPKKRPLSSMTPTLIFEKGKPMAATGSPGGSTIITVVLQTVLNMIEFDQNIATATATPRIHHQWLPDRTVAEPGISRDTVRLLEAMGHKIVDRKFTLGSTQSVAIDGEYHYGYSDSRRPGAATVGVEVINEKDD